MGLYWPNFSLVFLIRLFLYAGVYCTQKNPSDPPVIKICDWGPWDLPTTGSSDRCSDSSMCHRVYFI